MLKYNIIPLGAASPGLNIKSEGIFTVKCTHLMRYTALLGMVTVVADIAG
jgi:hypothetical protein